MKIRLLFIFLCLLVSSPLLPHQSGKFANGLEYYLMHGENSPAKASIWLVLKVGMMHENESQKGFAHLVEHLAWSGTENIPQLEKMLHCLGMIEFPKQACSMTGIDSTIFRLNIDLTHSQAMDQALFLLKEMSSSATLLPEDIESEKQEVIEEISNELEDPMRQKLEKQLEVLLGHPANIISPEIIQNIQHASPQQLRDFYHLHYRPDRMAIVAVGDFDETAAEKKIKELFEPLANPPFSPSYETDHPVQSIESPSQSSFLLLKHEDFSPPKISVTYLLPRNLGNNFLLLQPLIENHLQTLIKEKAVLSTSCSHTVLSTTHQVLEIGAVLFDEDSILDTAMRVIEELNRIEETGFTKEEWTAIQNKWRNFPPLDNEVCAKAYAAQFLGHPSSIFLTPIIDDQELEELIPTYIKVLKNQPKVITMALNSGKL